MLFLVTNEAIDPGPLLPLEDVPGYLQGAILPSLEMLAQWEEEGKIKGGGVFLAERAGAFLLEASSIEEADQLLTSLPFWGLQKWQVKPLQSHRSAIERARASLERVTSVLGG